MKKDNPKKKPNKQQEADKSEGKYPASNKKKKDKGTDGKTFTSTISFD